MKPTPLDLTAAALGLILLSPLLALIAILIKRETPGPVFYRGERAGLGGRTFKILKFRTMYKTPESYAGAPITSQGDQRVTPLGRTLRDTKLNDLPHLWNILLGDMSLVGPRPEDPQLTAEWPLHIRQEILSVRPGITSPASIQYRHEERPLTNLQPSTSNLQPSTSNPQPSTVNTYMEYILPDKLRLDQLYVRHRSFWLDIDTLLWTFVILIPRLGLTTPREGWRYLGPLSRFIRRYLNWFVIDTFVSLFAVTAAGAIYRTFGPLNVGELQAASIALAFALIFSLTSALLGVHRIQWSKAAPEDAFMLIPVVMIPTFIAIIANRSLSGDPFMPHDMVMLSGFLAFLGFIVVRYRFRLLRSFAYRLLHIDVNAAKARERVLIIGAGDSGQFAAYLLNQRRAQNAVSIAGFVDDDLYQQGTSHRGLDVISSHQDIPHLVHKHDIGVIVFAIHNISPLDQAEILEICATTPTRLIRVPDLGAVFGNIVNNHQPSPSHQESKA